MSEDRCCTYIVNEEPAYLAITTQSLRTFRQFNPYLKVKLFFVQDQRKDSRGNAQIVEKALYSTNLPLDAKSFLHSCEELGVEVLTRELPPDFPEKGYWSAQRWLFQEIEEPTVLLLDADTFIFGDLTEIFTEYKDYDFVATPNTFGNTHSLKINDKIVNPFNSGVVLWNNGWMRLWAKRLVELCVELRDRKHPLSEWLWSVSPECTGREELAATLFVLENNLKYRYFDTKHCHTEELKYTSLIFHTLSPNWTKYFNYFFPQAKKKLPMRLVK